VLEIRAATPLLVEKKAKDGHPKRNYKTLPTHPGTIELTEFRRKLEWLDNLAAYGSAHNGLAARRSKESF
jgi:hypothetical protein